MSDDDFEIENRSEDPDTSGFGYDDDIIGETDLHEVEPGDDFGTWAEVEDKVDVIRGDVYVGENPSAELHGIDVLGSAVRLPRQKTKLGFQIHTTKTGQQMLKLKAKVPKSSAAVIANARIVAKHAKQLGSKLQNFKPVTKQRVHGYILVGKAGRGEEQHTLFKTKIPVPPIWKTKQLAHSLVKDATKLKSLADKHEKDVKSAFSKNDPSKTKRQNHILGFDIQDRDEDPDTSGFGYDDDIIGEIIDEMCGYADAEIVGADPDPSNPGYLTDGSIDPNYQQPGSTDQGSSGSAPASADSQSGWQSILDADSAALANLPGPDANYGMPPRPTDYASAVAFMKDPTFGDPSNLSIEEQARPDPVPTIRAGVASGLKVDDTNWYTSWQGVPYGDRMVAVDPNTDYIVYCMDKIPFMNVGSYTEWFGTYPGAPAPQFGEGSGLELHDDGWYEFCMNQTNAGQKRLIHWDDGDANSLVKASIERNWGPLMGRPDGAQLWVSSSDEGRERWAPGPLPTTGLRYDAATGGFFWFWDQAPDNHPYKINQRNVYTQKAQTAYDTIMTTQKANYLQAVATMQQDQKSADDWNKQQAQVAMKTQADIDAANAANAKAEAAQQSQSNIAQSQLADQTAAFQLAQQQAQLEYDKQASSLENQAFQAAIARGDVPGADDGQGDSMDDGGSGTLDDGDPGVDDDVDWGADRQ